MRHATPWRRTMVATLSEAVQQDESGRKEPAQWKIET